jgi:peptide/nickel transport system substrate-binding protein
VAPRISRLVYPLLLIAGLALLAGWATRTSGERPSTDRHVEGVAGSVRAVNPLLHTDGPAGDLAALLFSGLMRIDGEGIPRPDLAERWEVTPDGRTYTFVLRNGLTWHDGHPLDASDVAYTISLLQSADFPGLPALAAPWTHVDVFVADARTILVRLEEPAADFLTHAAVRIVPEHLLGGFAPADLASAPFNRSPSGSGPYRLVRLDARGALLERNTSYHLGAPQVDRVELRFFDSDAALHVALAAGEVDAALLDDARLASSLLEDRPDLGATAMRRSAFTMLYLNNQVAPFDEAAVRSALLASIDVPALLEEAGVEAAPGDGVIVPGSWAYPALDEPGSTRPETLWQAAGLRLDASGVRLARDGQPLAFTLLTNSDPQREALAAGIARQLERWGVQVAVESLSAAELLQRHLQPRRYQAAIFGWEAAADPDPYAGWHASQVAAHGRNLAGYQDAAADALLESARATLDISERRDLYARFAERFRAAGASLVLYYPERTYVHPVALEGFEEGLLFAPASRFRDVHLWRLE